MMAMTCTNFSKQYQVVRKNATFLPSDNGEAKAIKFGSSQENPEIRQRLIGCRILFPTMGKSRSCKLLGYTDSNWCEEKDDRKSTAEYMFIYGETPISWYSKKEQFVSLSSCEANYIAASICVSRCMSMNLMKELYNEDYEVVTLIIYNISAIKLAKNPLAH